jgi:hypothetical protein
MVLLSLNLLSLLIHSLQILFHLIQGGAGT